MRKLNKNILTLEYKTALDNAVLKLSNKKINDACKYCEYAGTIAWYYPFLDKFHDVKIEKIVYDISHTFPRLKHTPIENNIVFYNSQIVDNGALTEQYLDYFIKSCFKVLFIVTDIKNTRLGKEILSKISNSNNVELFIPKSVSYKNKIIEIRTRINEFKPSTAFLHFTPSDIVACCSFLNIENINTNYIVHNDHTFWIGKSFFDNYIEFRHFGISMAFEKRDIPINKILYIPFYPINNKKTFEGFPFDRTGKIIGISGANLYKYLVDTELNYFKVIKDLLDENPDFIFCLTGWGDEDKILNFIKKNKLENRFYYLGQRTDFYSLIGSCDILFESYPMKGGLTPLFAIEQKIPCIGIASYNNFSGSLEELLGIDNYTQPTNFAEFKQEATKLIRNREYRVELAKLLSKNKCNKIDFENSLKLIFSKNYKPLRPLVIKPLQLDFENYLNGYLALKHSTYEELMRQKLFILKSSLSLLSRFKISTYAINAKNTKSIYDVLRLIIIVIFGK